MGKNAAPESLGTRLTVALHFLLPCWFAMHGSTSISYRPDIDGLRAVAVVSVVAYHAAPSLAPGGYVGVDVFFVISGFLISTIILHERAQGSFSLGGFYGRRIKRLFPALIVVLAATWLMGWYFLLPHEFRALGKHIAAGAAYFLNFTLKHESGYFDAASDTKPLLHLWSLAVEEQFYLVWPLLLLLIRERRHLLIALLLITTASFASNLHAVGKSPASAFYLPQNRVWELSLGALLAFATLHAAGAKAWLETRLRRTHMSLAALASLLSGAGLALILGAVFTLDDHVIYPGAWAVIPTLGAVLVIAAGGGGLVNRLLLSRRGVVFVGLISYSLYLWHWPLLSFGSILGLAGDWRVTLCLVAIAVGLAVVTYVVVERPCRRAQPLSFPVVLTGVTLSFGLAGVLSHLNVLTPRLDDFRYRAIGDALADWRFPQGMQRMPVPGAIVYKTTSTAPEKVLYFGDSNIQQYWPRIERVLHETETQKSVMFFTLGGCPPIVGVRRHGNPDCAAFAERGIEAALADDVTTVVIGAAWRAYFESSAYYFKGEGSGPIAPGTVAWTKAFSTLAATIDRLAKRGKTVWLVLNIPSGAQLAPQRALSRSWNGGVTIAPLQMDRAAFETSWRPVKAKLVEIARSSGAFIIDPVPSLCGPVVCPGQTAEGAPIYMDGSHLRASFVRDHAGFIDRTLHLETASLQ